MVEKYVLAVLDMAVLCITLVISSGIGIFFSIFGGRQKTTEEYLLAGRTMSIWPVAISNMATFMSATTMMGIPSEMYVYGTHMAFMNIGFILGPIIAAYAFLPVYFETGVVTSYEYLEKRFGKTSRRILSVVFLVQSVLLNGLLLTAPSLALSAVTNLSLWTSVVSIGAVCTFYCTLGGMKAILWSDAFQSLLMYACLVAVAVKACLLLEGIDNIFKVAREGGRLVLPPLNIDFSTRYTLWNVLLQGTVISIYAFCTNQMLVQRQLTIKSMARSQISVVISGPLIASFHVLCCLAGIVLYAYFQSCDPLTATDKPIQSPDQLLPYFILCTMRDAPGLPGLCIAGIFSASISSISSAINSQAAVTSEDIIKPLWPKFSVSVTVTKVLSLFYGTLTILTVYLTVSLGGLVKSTILVTGMIAGPSVGIYTLAAFSTVTNEEGAVVGALAAILFSSYAIFIPNERYNEVLPVNSNCSVASAVAANVTSLGYGSMIKNASEVVEPYGTLPRPGGQTSDDFPVSYMWISVFSLVICVIVGYCTSLMLNWVRGKSQPVDPVLLSPFRRWFNKKHENLQKELLHDQDLSLSECSLLQADGAEKLKPNCQRYVKYRIAVSNNDNTVKSNSYIYKLRQ